MLNRKEVRVFIQLLLFYITFVYSSDDKWIHSDKLDKLIYHSLSCHDIQGLGISVAKNNKIVYQKSFGYSDVKNKVPYSTTKTKILIASISKSFAAILISYYSIVNRFDMDVSINSILSPKNKVEFMTPCRTKMTTFEDLLAHRMAVSRHDFAFIFDGIQSNQLLERLRYIPSTSDRYFRVKLMYNNIMYGVAEKILERLVNQSYINMMQKIIFTPLNMTNTILVTKTTDLEDLARSVIINENINETILRTPSNILAACGIITTLKDMGKWQLFLINKCKTFWTCQLKLAVNKTIQGKISLGEDLLGFLTVKLNKTTERIYNIRKLQHFQYAMGWILSQYRGYGVFWHGGTYFGIDSILVWISSLNISIFINVNAKINLGYKKYQKIIQQIPLIIVDLYLDNHTRIVPEIVCHLFTFPSNKRNNNKSNKLISVPLNLKRDIFSIVNGKYNHPAFGDLNIRPFHSSDRSWILNPYENETLVLEYGKLFKVSLIRTIPDCKSKIFFSQISKRNDSKLFSYYGFYMYKGSPYWFLAPIVVPEINKNLTITDETCHLVIQHNRISNESTLQIRFLDDEITQFVRRNKGTRIIQKTFILNTFINSCLFIFLSMSL